MFPKVLYIFTLSQILLDFEICQEGVESFINIFYFNFEAFTVLGLLPVEGVGVLAGLGVDETASPAAFTPPAIKSYARSVIEVISPAA